MDIRTQPLAKVLIADTDKALIQSLVRAMKKRGYRAFFVRDGTKALQMAIKHMPDLILFSDGNPGLRLVQFAQILRTNQRTAAIPLLVMSDDRELEASAGQYSVLHKPIEIEDLLSRIEVIIRRRYQLGEVIGQDAHISGNLSQLPLPDLLQLFSENRRSGTLTVEASNGDRGWIFFREGAVVGAHDGEAQGKKALFRIIGANTGNFHFEVGDPKGDGIKGSISSLLLEGFYQWDELVKLVKQLPPLDTTVQLAVPRSRLPQDLDPPSGEIIYLMDVCFTMKELIEAASYTDYEALAAIAGLLERRIISFSAEPLAQSEGAPLLDESDIFAIRSKLAKLALIPGRKFDFGKILLLTPSYQSLKVLLNGLRQLRAFQPNRDTFLNRREGQLGFGTLGTLLISDTVQLVLFALPTDDSLRPLWKPFSDDLLALIAVVNPRNPLEGEQLKRAFAHFSGLDEVPVSYVFPHGAEGPEQGALERARKLLPAERVLRPLNWSDPRAIAALLSNLLKATAREIEQDASPAGHGH